MIKTIFSKIKLRFKSNKSDIFGFFVKNYQKQILVNCNNIMNYIKKPRKAKNKLLKLNLLCKIKELYFIYIFLSSFSLRFEIFLAIFNQICSFILFAVKNKVVTTITIIFNKIDILIIIKKQQIKHLKKLKIVYIKTKAKKILDQTILK